MKKLKYSFLALICAIANIQCEDDKTETVATNQTATYSITVNYNWNSTDFPTDYPSNPHFSPLVGLSHASDVTLFDIGSTATAGIQEVAETGGTTTIESEFSSEITLGNALDAAIATTGAIDATSETTITLMLDSDHPEVSLAAMIAPSPDWYIGIVGLSLLEDGEFVSSKEVSAISYDAGTDSGTTFLSANETTDPQGEISEITAAPLNGVPLATITFTKQ